MKYQYYIMDFGTVEAEDIQSANKFNYELRT